MFHLMPQPGRMTSREISETLMWLAAHPIRSEAADPDPDPEPVRTPLAATNPRKEEPMTTPGSAAGRGSATEQWNEAIETRMIRAQQFGKPITKDKAASALVRERPELHSAFLREANERAGHTYGVRRLSK